MFSAIGRASNAVSLAKLPNQLVRASSTGAAIRRLPAVFSDILDMLNVELQPSKTLEKYVRPTRFGLNVAGEFISDAQKHVVMALGKPAAPYAEAYLDKAAGRVEAMLCTTKLDMPHRPGLIEGLIARDVTVVDGNHPVAAAHSVNLVRTVEEFISTQVPSDTAHFVFIVGGGFTAMGSDNLDAAAKRDAAMRAGEPITVLNEFSSQQRLAYGGLLGLIRDRLNPVSAARASFNTMLVDDVGKNDPTIVGSSPTIDGSDQCHVTTILESSMVAERIEKHLLEQGHKLVSIPRGFMSDKEVGLLVSRLFSLVRQVQREEKGDVYMVLDGEPVVNRDIQKGTVGGRGSLLVAEFAKLIAGGDGIELLVVNTDGDDGNRGEGAAWCDGNTWSICDALGSAIVTGDTGRVLKAHGFTGQGVEAGLTNVNDVAVLRVRCDVPYADDASIVYVAGLGSAVV